MHTASYWEQTALLTYDIVIIGSGIIGLSTAAELLEHNPALQVCILEQGMLPTGATTRNAGFACFGSPTEIWSDIRRMGEDKTHTLIQERYNGLQKLRQRLGDNNIGFEHYGGFEVLTKEHEYILDHSDKINALTRDIVQSDYCHHDNSFIQQYRFSKNIIHHILHLPHEAQLHSGWLLRSLYKYVTERGAVVLTGCRVTTIDEETSICMVRTKSGNQTLNIRAQHVAVCSNAYITELIPSINIQPARGQILLTSPIIGLPVRGVFHADEGFVYFRSITEKNGYRILLGGARNHAFEEETTYDLTTTPTIQHHLENLLRTMILPTFEPGSDYIIESRWPGLMGFSDTKQPIITRVSPRIVAGFACNGMGVALGSLAGKNIADIIVQ